jgi:hypothetical protein
MSERSELKRIGAKQHKNSGRNMMKADGNLDRYVVDVKEYAKSFSINQDVWAKIVTDTLRVDPNKNPVLMIVLGESKKIRLAIIEWNHFEELRERTDNG